MIHKCILCVISLYCRYFPIERGKWKLRIWGTRFLKERHVFVTADEGVTLKLKFPEDLGWEIVYFHKTYETATTAVIKAILRDDDIVFDIGANIGWYTAIMASIVSRGHCYSFEPVPHIYGKLEETCRLNGIRENVTLNRIALGSEIREAEIYTYANLPHGHSSIIRLEEQIISAIRIPMVTLDSYVRDRNITKIDLVKVDVEGSELSVITGAEQILRMAYPPVWILEMNTLLADKMGYGAEHILERITAHHSWRLYRIAGAWDAVSEINSAGDFSNGDNILCIPGTRADALQKIDEMIRKRRAYN
jgi:FkbM family methyltransferase